MVDDNIRAFYHEATRVTCLTTGWALIIGNSGLTCLVFDGNVGWPVGLVA